MNIYNGDYRKLILIPLILLSLALSQIPRLKLGTDFTGGTLIVLQLNKHVDALELKKNLENEGLKANVKVYTTSFGERAEIEIGKEKKLEKADELRDKFVSLLSEVSHMQTKMHMGNLSKEKYEQKKEELFHVSDELFQLANLTNKSKDYTTLKALNDAVMDAYQHIYDNYAATIVKILRKYVDFKDMSIANTSPTLGKHFLQSAFNVALLAALLSTVVVFLFFRTLVPSIAILIGALSDITMALGFMAFFSLPLTLGSFSALLMLLGFSLDTDILLTMRMLKRKGDPREKAFDALKTGVTMSITAIFAFGVLYLVSLFTHISIYGEIATVALAGLVGDLFATWGINAVLLLLHVEGKI